MFKNKESYRVLTLDERIRRLENKRTCFLREIDEIDRELNEIYNDKFKQDGISSVKISIGDLKREMEDIKGSKISEFDLCALCSFYHDGSDEDIKDSKDSMDFFGSRLFVVFDDNTMVWYNHLNLFDDFYEEQIDGTTLIDHCSTRGRDCSKMKDLVVDKDIHNVMGKFNIDEITNDKNHCDNYEILPQAIFNSIRKGRAVISKDGYQKVK